MSKEIKLSKVTKDHLGEHQLLEYYGIKPELLADKNAIEEIMLGAAKEAKATIVSSYFNQFEPYGVSGVIIIKESHFTIHTWPEHGYASVDIYTCGDIDKQKAFMFLDSKFTPREVHPHFIKRGIKEEVNKHINEK